MNTHKSQKNYKTITKNSDHQCHVTPLSMSLRLRVPLNTLTPTALTAPIPQFIVPSAHFKFSSIAASTLTDTSLA